VRMKAIVLGAVAALAMATLTANAGTAPATTRASGSLISLVAATTTVAKVADRDEVKVATRNAENEKSGEPALKPVVGVKPVAPRAPQPSAACQQAINTLKAMHQADVAEDTAERAALQPLSAATIAADRAEDLAEVQPWKQALLAARTACLPQPSAACQAALATLQALRPATVSEDWRDMVKVPTPIDLAALRAAITAVGMACGDRD
jgi:hypothetical protein